MKIKKNILKKEISNKIMNGFNAVYLVDTVNETVQSCVSNNDVAEQVEGIIGECNNYRAVVYEYNNKYVADIDKERFISATRLSKIIDEVKQSGIYTCIFRRYNMEGMDENIEMEVVSISDETHLLFCFKTSQGINRRLDALYNGGMSYGKRNILVVDDDVISREHITDILGDIYNVICADNGAEGLRILKENYKRLSVVLLDIFMPLMSGYEFMEAVSDDKLLAQVPIIITTGNDGLDEEMKAMDFGAADFISKPYISGLVLARVKNVIKLRESSATISAMEYDSLTGLYTRQAFIHYADSTIKSNPDIDYTLIAVDLENYKLTNSQYGERRSDEFLSYFGECISDIFPNGINGRFGGDLFITLVRSDENVKGEQINQQIRKILRKAPIPHQIAKIGIYENIDKDMPIVASGDHVFLAIRKIKGIYKENIIYYTEEMKEKLIEEQYIQECMDEALEKEQFQVYYQPKHDCMNEKIVGAEALVRWKHPKYGLMSPAQFIPLFERNGFITKLDSYVIDKVCSDMQRWSRNGYGLIPVSVNASRRDFYEKGWLDQQLEIIKKYSIEPRFIHIEVTESLYVENADTIIEQVKKIQGCGHLIEMDDFGSGYSSLGMLADFPLDVVKLDISFVRRIEINEVVIEAIINLAHKMGFKVVAEGVETEKQYKTLRHLGCDYIQGYYFSKPLSSADFEKYLNDFQPGEDKDNCDAGVNSKWNALSEELQIKSTILECLDVLSKQDDMHNKINTLLSIIGRFYGSAHVYMIEYDMTSKKLLNTYQWIEEGNAIINNILDYINTDIIDIWLNKINENNEKYISEGTVVVPLKMNGVIAGFVGIDDPVIHMDSFVLMQSVSSFIMNEIERNKYVCMLEDMSYTDSLTGMKNRNALYRDTAAIEAENPKTFKSIGIIFADINGLKNMNDNEGHKAGDRLILRIAEILKNSVPGDTIYRVGGDEFVIFIRNLEKEEFEQKVEKLKMSWVEGCTASVGGIWLNENKNIERKISEADKEMYKEKNKYYKDKEYDRRKQTAQ